MSESGNEESETYAQAAALDMLLAHLPAIVSNVIVTRRGDVGDVGEVGDRGDSGCLAAAASCSAFFASAASRSAFFAAASASLLTVAASLSIAACPKPGTLPSNLLTFSAAH